MINHVRTLLLNRAGPHLPSDLPADAYVPPYEPVGLASNLRHLHELLVGPASDRPLQLVRTAQFMRILHSTEFEPHVYAADPRITYDPTEPIYADPSPFDPAVLASLPPRAVSELFAGRLTEPVRTYGLLYRDHPLLTYRLSGLLFGLAARMEALRRA